MALRDYFQKRNFHITSEPRKTRTEMTRNPGKRIFVIHEHQASHLHWDLRLEMAGVLKSWAIPKEPPRSKGIKRLAIQVEDHPKSYADFHGEIPEGQYGAGTVSIWDKGTFDIIEKTPTEIKIKMSGKKISGDYALIKTNYGDKPEKSWLFFRIN
jgi:DNA ligase D-like protein (predicted 3'-phosphoesterase)